MPGSCATRRALGLGLAQQGSELVRKRLWDAAIQLIGHGDPILLLMGENASKISPSTKENRASSGQIEKILEQAEPGAVRPQRSPVTRGEIGAS
jgi:hypothetical protein